MYRELLRRMVVFSDGTVPVSELDLRGERSFGRVDRAAQLRRATELLQELESEIAASRQMRTLTVAQTS